MKKTRILAISSAALALCLLAGCHGDEQPPITAAAAAPAPAAKAPAAVPAPRSIDCQRTSTEVGCHAIAELEEVQKQLGAYTAVMALSYYDKKKPSIDSKELSDFRAKIEGSLSKALEVDPSDASIINPVVSAVQECVQTAARAFKQDHDAFGAQADGCTAHSRRRLDDLKVKIGLAGFVPKPDFMSLRWGDPQPKVEEAIAGKQIARDGNSYTYATDLSGHPVHLVVWFVDGGLAKARYVFHDQHSEDGAYLSDFDEIDQLLTEKYGKPYYSGMEWTNNLFRDDPTRYGMALAAGHMRKASAWQNPLTEIQHLVGGDNFKVQHLIDYDSVEFAWAIQNAEKEKAKSAL